MESFFTFDFFRYTYLLMSYFDIDNILEIFKSQQNTRRNYFLHYKTKNVYALFLFYS